MNFIGRFVTSAIRHQVKQKFAQLKLGTGNVIIFNYQGRWLLRVITDGKALTDIHCDDDYVLQYVTKLSTRYQEITTSNHL